MVLPGRAGQAGLVRSCCLGGLLLTALVIALGFVAARALSRPQLGPGPTGARQGGSPEAIAANLAAQLARGLAAGGHAGADLSERDLTVIAAARNPQPQRFRDTAVRLRDGLVVLSALSSLGPFETTTVARARVGLVPAAAGGALMTYQLTELELGELSVPDWARDLVAPLGSGAAAIPQLLDRPPLAALRGGLECVSVGAQSLRIGVHAPGLPPDPLACGRRS